MPFKNGNSFEKQQIILVAEIPKSLVMLFHQKMDVESKADLNAVKKL